MPSRMPKLTSFEASETKPEVRRYRAEILWPAILAKIADGASLGSALKGLEPSPSYLWAKDWLLRDPVL